MNKKPDQEKSPSPVHQHGGRRPGAGRPKGSGKHGAAASKVIRVPADRLQDVKSLLAVRRLPHRVLYPAAPATVLSRPLYGSRVSAGFPSPADDYVEGELDLNRHLVKRPNATFFVRVSGESMIGAGIHPGDILVVDRALEPENGKIVIAVVNGELTVKRLQRRGEQLWLLPENEAFTALQITEAMDFQIWGVVTNVVHAL